MTDEEQEAILIVEEFHNAATIYTQGIDSTNHALEFINIPHGDTASRLHYEEAGLLFGEAHYIS